MRLHQFVVRVRALLSRLRGSRETADIDARLADEIRFHLDMQTAKNVANGMSHDDARRAALVRFGGVEQHKEATRDEYRARLVEDALHDVRYAFRSLRSAPVFALTTILTLAIGIGANTAIFSAVDGVLLKPLPFAEADRLMAVAQHDGARGAVDAAAPANFLDWKQRSRSFGALAAAEPYSMALVTPDGPEMARNWNVTEDFFSALGVRPAAGRFFEPADFQTNAARVVVISYEAWQRRFGGAPDVVGRRLQLAGSATTIIGIIPRGAAYPPGREFWSPKIFTDEERQIRGSAFYPVIGRLRDGVSVNAARAEMATIAAQLASEYPRTNANIGVAVTPMADNIVGGLRRTLWLLVGAVGLLLLVACANVANLLLTRTFRRGRELAIRTALGAGQGRVVRLLMAESLVLACIGAAGGVVLARWGVAAIRTLSPPNLPRIDSIQVDLRALAFALIVALITTAVFGLVPSLRAARGDVHGELKSGARSAGGNREHRRARHTIVAAEVALAVVLLTGAGLLVRSFMAVLSVDRGYRAERVVMATMFTWQWMETADRLTAFGHQLATSIGAMPGISAAAIVTSVPLADPIGPTEGRFIVEGRAADAERDARAAHVTVATPQVFDVLGIPVLRGRGFTNADDASRNQIVVINETMAQRYFGGENPIGKRIHLRFAGPPVTREIVGVVVDVHQRSLEQPAPPALFIPFAQAPTGSIAVVARTASSPADAIPVIRGVVRTLLPDLPIGRTATLEGLTNDALRFRRFVLLLLTSFALTALTLAIVGVYGLIAQSVAERTQEIGVRIALGAHAGSVLSLVMRQALAPALAGIVVGLATSATATRLLAGMLFEVTPLDVTTFAIVALVILALAGLASSIPAWRATRVDPLAALRSN